MTKNFSIVFRNAPLLIAIGNDVIKFFIMNKEYGSIDKKLHFQCYVEFEHHQTFASIKALFNDYTCHIEPAKENRDVNVLYCSKGFKKEEPFVDPSEIFNNKP